jgi:dipeptidyl aminopeptidase/acylaminoacyl peptidase
MNRRFFSSWLVALLLVASASAVLAQTGVWTPQEVASLRSATSVRISPDGARVAYLLSVPRDPFEEDNGAPWGELHVVGRDGVSRAFVTGNVNLTQIAWRPDGRAISFLAKRGNDEFRSIYVIDADGGEARRIVNHTTDIGSYSWSPDSRQVAFLAREPVAQARRDVERRGFTARVYEENDRPDRIWVATPGTAEKARLIDIAGAASDLRWSPAGNNIAVAIAPTSAIDESYTSRRVTVIDTVSGSTVATLATPGKLGEIAWSPDGRRLAVISAADRNDPSAGRLLVAQIAGGEVRDLLPGYEANVSEIAWRDANTVLYVGDEGVWTTLAEVRHDGSGRKTLIPAGREPVMTSMSASRSGAIAFAAESPSHPSEVYLWTTGAPRRLTDSNPNLKNLPLAQQEIVTYAARDGLRVEGLLIRPLGERRGERYPLILVVHGGPEAHYRNGWLTGYSNPGQLGASRGYAVFYPNYRGSTGRGVAFSKMGQGDPAGKEFDDLVDGVDHLIATGLVDGKRVGITGGSYGGYATAWGSTYYSERFAAGVMFVGISSLISKWGTTDIPEEEYLVHALQYPWDNWQFHLERSPIFYADRSRTPLLILVGEQDTRVHPGQSMELYRHLRARGKAPVRLVMYPDEAHGNRRAAARLDYTVRMMQWFDHYLKGAGGAPPPPDVEYRIPAETAEQPE